MPRVMLDVMPGFVQAVFAGFHTSPHYSLGFSFSDLDQVFRDDFSFSGLGSQMSQFQSCALTISYSCSWHFCPPFGDSTIAQKNKMRAARATVSEMQRYHCHIAMLQVMPRS
jgi:hypothetical protein